MIAIGFLLGIISIVSVFLPWEAYVGNQQFYLTRINEFLGIRNNSYDNLFGLDFLPILCALLFMLCFCLAKIHASFRILALASSFVSFAIGAYNIVNNTAVDFIPGVGIWIFTIASLSAFIISVLIIAKNELLEKKIFSKIFD